MLGERGTDTGTIGLLSCVGPIARSFRDCEPFMRVTLDAQPWLIDPSTLRIPWRFNEVVLPNQLILGVVRWDHFVMPHPQIAQALDITVELLRKAGHEVIEWDAREHGLASSDITVPIFYPNGARQVFDLIDGMREPWIGPIVRGMRDNKVAQKHQNFRVEDYWNVNAARYQYRVKYAKRWNESGKLSQNGRIMDGILSPAGTSVSFPHDFNR